MGSRLIALNARLYGIGNLPPQFRLDLKEGWLWVRTRAGWLNRSYHPVVWCDHNHPFITANPEDQQLFIDAAVEAIRVGAERGFIEPDRTLAAKALKQEWVNKQQRWWDEKAI